MTLFRFVNVASPGQVRELTDCVPAGRRNARRCACLGRLALSRPTRRRASSRALGDGATPFGGNMALGAVDDIDSDRTSRVRRSAPRLAPWASTSCTRRSSTSATEPANVALGIRSFGDDPAAVGRHGAAMVRAEGGRCGRRDQALPGSRRCRQRHAPRPGRGRRVCASASNVWSSPRSVPPSRPGPASSCPLTSQLPP